MSEQHDSDDLSVAVSTDLSHHADSTSPEPFLCAVAYLGQAQEC